MKINCDVLHWRTRKALASTLKALSTLQMCPFAYTESINSRSDIASVLPAARHPVHERPGIIAARSETSEFAKVLSLMLTVTQLHVIHAAGSTIKQSWGLLGFFCNFFIQLSN